MPECGERVFEAAMPYVCEKSVGPNRHLRFRTGKSFCNAPFERAQVQKVARNGKTDLD